MKKHSAAGITGMLILLLFSSCATPLKTAEVRARTEPGVSAADTLVTLGIPDSQQTPQADRRLLVYHDTGIYFVDDKLVYVFNTKEQNASDLKAVEAELGPRWKEISANRHKIVYGENQKGPVNAYRAFYYLNDEVSFRESIRRQIDPEGYSTDLNALCLAIRGGFTEAVKELLAINVRTDRLLSDHRAGKSQVRVSDCVWFQENKPLSAQYAEMIKTHERRQEELAEERKRSGAPEVPGEEKKSGINWDAVKDWLKPQVPAAPAPQGGAPTAPEDPSQQ